MHAALTRFRVRNQELFHEVLMYFCLRRMYDELHG
jgi:hypothetical protein